MASSTGGGDAFVEVMHNKTIALSFCFWKIKIKAVRNVILLQKLTLNKFNFLPKVFIVFASVVIIYAVMI